MGSSDRTQEAVPTDAQMFPGAAVTAPPVPGWAGPWQDERPRRLHPSEGAPLILEDSWTQCVAPLNP